jgi:CheY-like chemotaxis protein
VVRVPRRVFQRLLPERPTPERCVEAYYLQRTRFESIAERKLRRRQLTEDGNGTATDRCRFTGLNGRQLAEQARQRVPRLKVVYMTGYARNAIVHHGVFDAGVDLLGKPFTTEGLGRKLQEVLRRD